VQKRRKYRINSTAGCKGVSGLATIQELRSAVQNFRNEDKKPYGSVFYTDSFGEAENKILGYYLASAFGRIYLQPIGLMVTPGFVVHTPFLNTLLTNYGAELRIWAKGEYKNSINMFTENDYTEAHAEQVRWILDGIFEQVVSGIAEGRQMSMAHVEEAVNMSPLTAVAALNRGLIDHVGYEDEMWSGLRNRGCDLPTVSLKDYLRIIQQEKRREETVKGSHVAVLYAQGEISLGWSSRRAVKSIESNRLVHQLDCLLKSKDVKAVVLRVDSNGGSSIASDSIRRKLMKFRDFGKHVVVSMGNAAASGGYYISLGANTIVANPGKMSMHFLMDVERNTGSLTGSIGVFVAIPYLKDALQARGINVSIIKKGNNADLFSFFKELDPSQEQMIQSLTDEVYERFKARVCESKNLQPDVVRNLAKGKVWLGQSAKDNLLVDEIGGLTDAIRIAKIQAGLPQDARVVDYPSHSGFWGILSAIKFLFPFRVEDISQLMELNSSIQMYSLDADIILKSVC